MKHTLRLAVLTAFAATGLLSGCLTLPHRNMEGLAPVQPAEARASATTKLVGGKVQSPVSRGQGFDAPGRSAVPNPTGSLQMYSRAADRVEVATAAHLGRMLDTRA